MKLLLTSGGVSNRSIHNTLVDLLGHVLRRCGLEGICCSHLE